MPDHPEAAAGLDQAELDRQYNNREHVANSAELMDAYKRRGDAYAKTAAKVTNIAFGPSPAEVLDIYPATSGKAPVLIYLHGGYWYSRHKDDFRFIAGGFQPQGAMTVVVNYALIPDVDMAELVRQCRAAIAWTYKNATLHGGDPDRIYIFGHSAGGHLTAMMFATDWSEWGVPASAIKGGFAVSGIYDLEPIRHCFMNPTLGFTEKTTDEYSPVHLVPSVNAPLVLAVGDAETDEFQRQNTLLAPAWAAHGFKCEEMVGPGLNHFTVLEDLSTPGHAFNKRVLELMGLD
ncbi:MAG: alpha/beta hydrolase [Proteobacteria bacterium]|nr:alpha/beta hydrolase [Pseudomonadota bacterium]